MLFVPELDLLHRRPGNSGLMVYHLLDSLRKMKNRDNPNKIRCCILRQGGRVDGVVQVLCQKADTNSESRLLTTTLHPTDPLSTINYVSPNFSQPSQASNAEFTASQLFTATCPRAPLLPEFFFFEAQIQLFTTAV